MQPYFDPTVWNMEDDLNFLGNGRRPQLFEKRKKTNIFCKWKTTSIFLNWRRPHFFVNGRQPHSFLKGRPESILKSPSVVCLSGDTFLSGWISLSVAPPQDILYIVCIGVSYDVSVPPPQKINKYIYSHLSVLPPILNIYIFSFIMYGSVCPSPLPS